MKVAGADACRLVFLMVNAQLPCSLIASYGKSVITATTRSEQAQSTILIYTFRHKTCPRSRPQQQFLSFQVSKSCHQGSARDFMRVEVAFQEIYSTSEATRSVPLRVLSPDVVNYHGICSAYTLKIFLLFIVNTASPSHSQRCFAASEDKSDYPAFQANFTASLLAASQYLDTGAFVKLSHIFGKHRHQSHRRTELYGEYRIGNKGWQRLR